MRLTKITLLLFILLTFVVPSWSMDSAVYYFTGRVYSFDEKNITVGDKTFLLAKICSYLRHYRKNNAYFEDRASARDLRNGDSVTLHINGNVVDKIIVEEWKR